MKRTLQMAPPRPDRLGDQLMTALVERSWFEFKPLFLQVYASLRERNVAHGGEEMLRLSAYDKLQNMVRRGLVEKEGKMYRGKLPELTNYAELVAAAQSRSLLEIAARAQ